MKRKLDEREEPAAPAAESQGSGEQKLSFDDLGLDPRLVSAIAHQKLQRPTLVQQKGIPLALAGKDVLARAKTGSGKTLAYVLPVLQSVLERKRTNPSPATTTLILVPTRELADQVSKVVGQFSSFCAKDVQTVKLTDSVSDAVHRSLLSSSPDIVISTPAKAWHSVSASFLSLEHLSLLVVDEADLVLSYGHGDDLENLQRSLPKGVQSIMTSATLTPEVDTLKGMFCRNPVLLDLDEPEAAGEGVTQYVVKCAEDEKFLLIYVILKLQLIKGKCIVFVADIDRCYRLKLFLGQFSISSVVLNSEMPVNSRINVVEQFNQSVYSIIIASDEGEVLGDEDQLAEEEEKDVEATGSGKETASAQPKKKRRTSKGDKNYGVSRGIDFKNVACVINFDLPTSARSYTHRIGRTARAGQRGTALSFVVPQELYRKHMPTTVASAADDEKVLARLIKQQAKKGKEVKDYVFDMKQVESFRYRMNDGLRAITRTGIREARASELRRELIASEKLKRHFEENPAELRHLRHDGEIRTGIRTQAHLKSVPDYLLPRAGKTALMAGEPGFVPSPGSKGRKAKYFNKGKGKKGVKVGRNKANPLSTFKAKRKKRA